MNTLQQFMRCDGCTSRKHFLRNILLLAAGKTAIDLQVIHLRPDLARDWSWPLSWLDPFRLVGPWLNGNVAFIICLTSFLFFSALVWNAVHRARDAGWPHWLGVLTAVPFVNIAATIVLALPPHKKRSVWDII
jgi:uncharacterized membrane protein YhaH (DUF805 family)